MVDSSGNETQEVSTHLKADEIWLKLLPYSFEHELLKETNTYPNIPELMDHAEQVTGRIHSELFALFGDRFLMDPVYYIMASLGASAYAGMGAVYHWQQNREELFANGIYETLVAELGLNSMGVHVLNAIGIGYKTPESDQFEEHLKVLETLAMFSLLYSEEGYRDKQLVECQKAMFKFGMVLEMQRLGLGR